MAKFPFWNQNLPMLQTWSCEAVQFGAAPGKRMFMYLEAFGPCKLNPFYLQLGSHVNVNLTICFSTSLSIYSCIFYPLWLASACPGHKCGYKVVCILAHVDAVGWTVTSGTFSSVCVFCFFFSLLASKLKLNKLLFDWHLLWRCLNYLDTVTFTHLLLY